MNSVTRWWIKTTHYEEEQKTSHLDDETTNKTGKKKLEIFKDHTTYLSKDRKKKVTSNKKKNLKSSLSL